MLAEQPFFRTSVNTCRRYFLSYVHEISCLTLLLKSNTSRAILYYILREANLGPCRRAVMELIYESNGF